MIFRICDIYTAKLLYKFWRALRDISSEAESFAILTFYIRLIHEVVMIFTAHYRRGRAARDCASFTYSRIHTSVKYIGGVTHVIFMFIGY